MMKLFLILAGGAIGSILRYGMSGLLHRFTEPTFPYGTLSVNLVGCAVIGFFWGLWESSSMSSEARSFVFVGLLGGFTTFSTYALESMNLLRDGEIKLAMLNILANNFAGLALVVLTFYAARFWAQR